MLLNSRASAEASANIPATVQKLVDPETAGDPMSVKSGYAAACTTCADLQVPDNPPGASPHPDQVERSVARLGSSPRAASPLLPDDLSAITFNDIVALASTTSRAQLTSKQL